MDFSEIFLVSENNPEEQPPDEALNNIRLVQMPIDIPKKNTQANHFQQYQILFWNVVYEVYTVHRIEP